MKKTLLLTLLLAVSLGLRAQSGAAQAVAGRYTGELYVSLIEESYTDETRMPEPTTVEITASADGTIEFALNNFTFADALLGDIRLPEIAVTAQGPRYTFGANPVRRFSFLEGEIVADARLDETRSYAEGDSLTAYIPVEWVMTEEERIPIYVLFKGKAEDSEEPSAPGAAQAVAGAYEGDLYVSLIEESYTDETRMPDPTTVKITATASGTIEFALNDFTFADALLGDIRLPEIAVTAQGPRYTFGENPARRFSFLEGEIVADARLDETRSYIEGDSLTAYIPVEWVMTEEERIPIYVLFKGKRTGGTGISTPVAAPSRKGIYDLSGRRLQPGSALPRGLYIIDGKKQIIR